MKSRLTEDFIARFSRLPSLIRKQARNGYRRWKADPNHPGLVFKRIHAREPIYSVRIGLGWRAVGLMEGDSMTWFWIGSHAEYDKLISQQ